MSVSRKASNRRIANLEDNLRAFDLPPGWLLQTGILLLRLQEGSYAAKNRDRIVALAKRRKQLRRSASARLRKPWQPEKNLAEMPAYTRTEAYGRRLVVRAYHESLANELIPAQAEKIARVVSILVLGKRLCGKSVRRLVALVEERGGIAEAPIEAFATERSVPHPGNTRAGLANKSR